MDDKKGEELGTFISSQAIWEFLNNFAISIFIKIVEMKYLKFVKNMIPKIILPLLLVLIWTGCANDMNSKFNAPKNAFGQANRLCVIADQDVWEGAIGDSIRYLFGAAYPILPQPEPLFDLQHFTPLELDLDGYRKELRAYLIVGDLSNPESPTVKSIIKDLGAENLRKAREQSDFNIKVGYNKWAQGQTLVYLFAQSKDQLLDASERNFPAIANKLHKTDKEQFEATLYFGGENESVKQKVKDQFEMNLRIPSDYFVAIQDSESIWLRKETEFISSNILIHKTAYINQDQLTKQGIKKLRDKLGKQYISTEIKDTYMRTNDVDLPMLTKAIDLNGAYTIEARGIWDIVNDFMGGPFLSYLVLNKEKNELIFIDCFVHAPGKKKRDYMMHLEYIIESIKFSKTQ